ncbi:hypothetical protein BkAM31D_02310 [Halalkalibacter krulwichiae]|uniref:Uncharacterized protein n=1 Tax=Halalkalibacter krulwichiae TaxID=199441 RepID=A0A1X9M5P6_9BACI|nr:hypothetical protein BkAM31D_02310 [Halalkalibacter krulwichiae]
MEKRLGMNWIEKGQVVSFFILVGFLTVMLVR